MKKVLLATTMFVAGASVAAADVTLSGDGRMGVISSGSDDPRTPTIDESGLAFTSRARVAFGLSGETDGGLQFGGSFRADNAGGAAGGTAGSVFLSGAFGKISMGDVDGAAQMATGHVAGVGFTGLGDLNESTFLGAGGANLVTQAFAAGPDNPLETTDPTVLYEYSFGDFTFYASHTNTRPVTSGNAAANTGLNSNATAAALGAKYTFSGYTIGLGYEKLSGYIAPAGVTVATPLVTAAKPLDNTDLDHVVLTLEGKVAGLTVKGLIGQASGRLAGVNIKTPANNGKQYAASATYTTGALSGTLFYADDSALGGTAALGVGASYDLGGGAAITGGWARTKVAGRDSSTADLGVTFKF
ncbi:porin [Fuscovulum ytuae]|uniref:Porin n=1 Tax=Fuscovulum ytuae TaxID=3042299 RepID=A0ABY8Q3A5_9RHOB|nr:porin [Fuscovulum sp. YMD61]WGV15328.1 porin [Fuscovulum sp. YMD61]